MPVTSRYSSPVNYQSILGTDSYKYFSNSSRYFNSIPTSSTSATTKRGSGNNDTSSSAYSNRFVSSLSNCNRSSTSSAIRSSIDRDTLTKPPIGSSTLARLRSESRLRDHSLDSSSYPSSTTKSSQGKSNDQLYSHLSAPYKRHSLKNIPSESSYTSNSSSSSSTPSSRLTLPSPSSSLEHYVAISGLDIQKYSPANYIPRHELLRSRSLSEATSSKLNAIDKSSSSVSSSGSSSTLGTTSTSTTTPSSATSKYNRSTSNDRDATNKIRNSSSLARLPPSSSSSLSSSATNRFRDRDGGAAGGGTAIGGARTSSRTLSDSDAFNRSSLISSSSDKLSNSDNSEGLCGLRNIGNTCYMNSVLQCLSHTNELTQYLKNKSEGRSQTKDERILNEFISLIKDMWSPNTRTVTPSELKSAFSSKHRMYYGSIQQDAQEFLRFFLDSLHCGLNKGVKGDKLVIDDSLSDNSKADLTWEWYSKFENSKIKDLFVGQLKSSLKCTVCGNTSVTFDPFWDLSVPLTPLSTSSKCKLESCMDLFIKEEILDGDEMPTCSKCNTRRKSTKSLTIQRFPKYLVIHLKRFSETRWSKIANIVEFPTGDRGLNMAPYAANSSSVIYSLYGISNHMGSTAEGHYVALCKHPVTKKWHEFNDNSVSDRSESSLVSSSAYLLFYERS